MENNKPIKILALGDVVGTKAVWYLSERLWKFRERNQIDFVICNAENAYNGSGLDPQNADKLISAGCDVLTGGNHTFKRYEIKPYLEDSKNVIRPANFPAGTPGNGYTIVDNNGYNMLVINVLGTIFMEPLACPFETVDRILERENGNYDFAFLDIHAEATSEKIALAHYFDGRINCIFGTHTHVQTADNMIFPKGSGYITDLGMCGPDNSVLGDKPEIIIERLTKKLPVKFEVSQNPVTAHGVIFSLSPDTGKCISALRVVF